MPLYWQGQKGRQEVRTQASEHLRVACGLPYRVTEMLGSPKDFRPEIVLDTSIRLLL